MWSGVLYNNNKYVYTIFRNVLKLCKFVENPKMSTLREIRNFTKISECLMKKNTKHLAKQQKLQNFNL